MSEGHGFSRHCVRSTLWNIFFASCCHAVRAHHFDEVVFADDLNCYRKYHVDVSNVCVNKDLKSCQSSLHDWGRSYLVEFESTKESCIFCVVGIRKETI